VRRRPPFDENHQVLACELTTPETGAPTAIPDLLDPIDTPFDTFMADGVYDGDRVTKAVLSRQPDAKVIVAPHKTAVCLPAGDSQRDNPIQVIDHNVVDPYPKGKKLLFPPFAFSL
jgi:hypothetical protein